MRIGMTGGRDSVLSFNQIKEFIRLVEQADVFVHGCARGADRFAEGLVELNYPWIFIKRLYPDWNRYGRIAGFVRNKEIIDSIDLLIAFHGGNGTENCKKQALLWNVTVVDLSGLK